MQKNTVSAGKKDIPPKKRHPVSRLQPAEQLPRGPAANWYGRAVASHARAADDPSPCSRPAPPCRSCGNPDNAGALHQLSAAVLSSPALAVVAWPRLVSTKKN